MPAAGGCAQKLATYRTDPLHEMGDRHIIAGAEPAVAVAVEQHFAGDLGRIGAGCMPDAPVKEDRVPQLGAYGQATLWFVLLIKRQFVQQMAAGDDVQIGPA